MVARCCFEAVLEVVHPALDLGVDQRRRRIDVDQLDQGVDGAVAQRHGWPGPA